MIVGLRSALEGIPDICSTYWVVILITLSTRKSSEGGVVDFDLRVGQSTQSTIFWRGSLNSAITRAKQIVAYLTRLSLLLIKLTLAEQPAGSALLSLRFTLRGTALDTLVVHGIDWPAPAAALLQTVSQGRRASPGFAFHSVSDDLTYSPRQIVCTDVRP